eukprot:4239685-Amphidinium_carterae.4
MQQVCCSLPSLEYLQNFERICQNVLQWKAARAQATRGQDTTIVVRSSHNPQFIRGVGGTCLYA